MTPGSTHSKQQDYTKESQPSRQNSKHADDKYPDKCEDTAIKDEQKLGTLFLLHTQLEQHLTFVHISSQNYIVVKDHTDENIRFTVKFNTRHTSRQNISDSHPESIIFLSLLYFLFWIGEAFEIFAHISYISTTGRI